MRTHVLFAIIISLFFTKDIRAQYAETIVSGRPGQANGPFGVGKGIYQIQSGIDYDHANSDYGNKKTTFKGINQNSVIRLGFGEHFELRLGYGYQLTEKIESTLTNEFPEENAGFNAFRIGVRQNISKQNGILPALGIQFTAKFGGLNRYERDKYNYEGKLLLQHKLSNKLSLNTNLSVEYNDDYQNTFGRYVFSFGYSLSEKFGLVAETYGLLDENNNTIYFDAGVSYLHTNNLQFDIYSGFGNNKIGPAKIKANSYFISAGVSFRINTRD